ncbi:fimbrial biogenesis chaperone [Sphingobacterium pedocola]|uniref:Pili assembly chaperone N-terminal domain-containing protein n=1 Tax=Sphingobacterium pedocola TaxID=2082722 RepID=A0ABR9T9P5_9SPHI|nr:hypothetical protein [Sphingobacterium pedocola]MBE8722072.1 hypothetical protein [Sphingobacterium pedocola]
MNLKMLFSLRALRVLSLFILTVGSSYAQDISVSPSVITLSGNPGETISETLTITNSGKMPYEFLVSIKDWKREISGNKVHADAGTLPNSNSAWIRVAENSFVIKPGERKLVTIYMEIPAEGVGHVASNSMVFLTQTNPQESATNESAIGIKIAYEFGVQLFYNPAAAQKGEIEYEQLTFISAQDEKAAKVQLQYKNDGDVNKTGTIRVELTNKESGEEFKLQPVPFAIMPHDVQIMQIALPAGMPKGNYLLVSLLDAGAGYNLKVAEKDIYVE